MRVTAGKYKNKQVKTVKSNDVRPTLSKIRESIFNIIQNKVENSSMLDLFAGSGIMGIEAVSRGVNSVTYIEKNPRTARILKENLREFDFEYKVFIADALKAVDKLAGKKFDIIFVDPPYAAGLLPEVLDKISKNDILSDDGVLIIECGSDYKVDEIIEKTSFIISKQKKYGDTAISIIKK